MKLLEDKTMDLNGVAFRDVYKKIFYIGIDDDFPKGGLRVWFSELPAG